MSAEELASASMKLRKNLDSSSRVIIGDFDKTGDPISKASGHSVEDKTPAFLIHLGFRPVDFEPCNPYENVLKTWEKERDP